MRMECPAGVVPSPSLRTATREPSGFLPDEDLTDEELETRARLSPSLALFKRLERDEKAGGGRDYLTAPARINGPTSKERRA